MVHVLRLCLSCGHPFPEGRLEALPAGEGAAYGPDNGRLWLICGRCGGWSLVPLESRWEALEALEAAVKDEGTVLASTANISLVDAAGLRLVRVGSALRAEQAWWRFGRRLRDRRRRYLKLARWNAAFSALAAPHLTVLSYVLNRDRDVADRVPPFLQPVARRLALGRHAWRGDQTCVSCGRACDVLTFARAGALRLALGKDATIDLRWECGPCRLSRWGLTKPIARTAASSPGEGAGGRPFGRDAAEALLRRYLQHSNFRGAGEVEIERAATDIGSAGTARAWVSTLGERGIRLDEMGRAERLTLEMALGESVEARWLELEAAELERQWRRAEELAAIIDGELTP
ncbi:MAG: hypothetical protein ABFS34_10160 [Gemmatimonadota bacterium]